MIKFFIRGNPIPQPRPRVTVRGRFPHAYVPQSHDIWGWRAVIDLCGRINKPAATLSGPLQVDLIFCMRRPQSHYGTGKNAGVLKADAPKFHTVSCDLDNLMKPVFDVLTECQFWGDDSQIAVCSVVKRYAKTTPGCWVVVRCVETRKE